MAKNREKLAELLGAKIVGEVPDVGGGAFGMARLAHILYRQLKQRREEPGGRRTIIRMDHPPDGAHEGSNVPETGPDC